jgi:hypothetical protein
MLPRTFFRRILLAVIRRPARSRRKGSILLRKLAFQFTSSRLTHLIQLAILNAASIVGRIIPGALAPKLGSLNMSIFFIIVLGIVTCCMPIVHGRGGVAVYAIIYGSISGACTSIFHLLLQDSY